MRLIFFHKHGKFIILGICIVFFIYSINYNENTRKKYLKDSVWTIAKTVKDYGEHVDIGYKYFVDGKLLYSSAQFENNPAEVGHFYLMKYSRTKPEISEIYFDKEITDRIKIRKAGYKVIDENIGL